MGKLKTGIIGMGYIGESHIDAVRRIHFCELTAIADVNAELARQKAEIYGVPKCYDSVDALLADPEIQVVHNCTPNFLHTEINAKILRAGKHLISEKPLAGTYEDAMRLVEIKKDFPQLAACVNYNYRMNPLVLEMKARIDRGEAGDLRVVTGTYQQDWLTDDTDYSWRLEPSMAGISCAVADIGTHWMDCVQFVTGEKITEVMADLTTVIPVRKKPRRQTETFTAGSGAYDEVLIQNEECASVLFHMTGGIRGVFHVSEVAPGHGCYLNFEVNGSKTSMRWNQEEADRLWIGRRDGDNSYVLRSPGTVDPSVRPYTSLAMGHPEGWNDAFRNNLMCMYRWIDSGMQGTAPFATLEEAAYLEKLVDSIVKSSKERRWVSLNEE